MFQLLSPISTIVVVVNPTIVNLVKKDRWSSPHHPKPVLVMHEEVPLATYAFVVTRLESVTSSQVPFAHAVFSPAGTQVRAIRDHGAKVLRRPVLVIIHKKVGFSITIDV